MDFIKVKNFPNYNQQSLLEAVKSKEPVRGLTHNFYRYPARFSPLFAREIIKAFTNKGDLVFDPFMGGGTTLVESFSMGRSSLGLDVSTLSTFISQAKTTLLSEKDIISIIDWSGRIQDRINLRNPAVRAIDWELKGYQKNISNRTTWPIRKTLELILATLHEIPNKKQNQFIRCALLKTAQWAFDCFKIPSAKEFRKAFIINISKMVDGMREFKTQVRAEQRNLSAKTKLYPVCLSRSAVGIEKEKRISKNYRPKLVLTSPPYPGVHVLYHRWQIRGRKETPAPFWIANCLDGNKAAYYAFGDRHQDGLASYFQQQYLAFSSIAKLLDKNSLVVQMVAFSDLSWQLQKYLETMEQAGFKEVYLKSMEKTAERRLWRTVPGRKWYAQQKGTIASSKEVVLFHQLA